MRFQSGTLKPKSSQNSSGFAQRAFDAKTGCKTSRTTLSEQVGIAKTSFFPRISLSGVIGYAGFNWDDLFKPSSVFENLAANGSMPLFQGGRLRTMLAQDKAAFEQQLELYKQVAIEAITEVDDLLQSTRLLESQSNSLGQAVEAAQKAREISSIQYERGLVDFITALDAERTALDIEQQYVQVQRTQFTNTVNLLRALGGSWLPANPDQESFR
ncbi:MAG: TolC family protein [Verrucomicrobiia bacterium]